MVHGRTITYWILLGTKKTIQVQPRPSRHCFRRQVGRVWRSRRLETDSMEVLTTMESIATSQGTLDWSEVPSPPGESFGYFQIRRERYLSKYIGLAIPYWESDGMRISYRWPSCACWFINPCLRVVLLSMKPGSSSDVYCTI